MLLKDIANKLGAKLVGDGEIDIADVANLKTAQANEISFLSDPKYRSVLSESNAGAVIVKEVGFGIGLTFLNPIFTAIIAFDSSITYKGKEVNGNIDFNDLF